MKLKKATKTARNLACVRAKVRESQECLRELINEIEQQFSAKIKDWDTKDAKKLYSDYSLYLLMEELLQAVEKASNRV